MSQRRYLVVASVSEHFVIRLLLIVGGGQCLPREKTPDGSQLLFDHGAQYISVKDPVVQELVDTWEAAGYLADWKGKFGVLHMGTGQFTADVVSLYLFVSVAIVRHY